MKRSFDEITLSAYIDGELDTEAMKAVEDIIESDASAKRYVLDSVSSSAHLRAALRGTLDEEVPARLLAPFKEEPSKILQQRSPALRHIYRIAAAVVFLLIGFGVSEMVDRSGRDRSQALIEPLSGPYRQVVDAALENYLSGTSHEWRQGTRPTTVRVTPLKTYRDKTGRYFREYRLEVTRNNQSTYVNGLAYRASKGNWKTKALYF